MKGRPIHLIAHAAHPSMVLHRATRLGSTYRPDRVIDWLKIKNPKAPAVKREAHRFKHR